MHRYFIFFAYDGTSYHGWQRQPNAMTVQERMEDVMRMLLGRKVNLVAAGRTDTGVHARRMAAHFDVETEVDCRWLAFKLNCLLPQDIAVSSVVPVRENAHARFSARRRTYRYHLYLKKDPFCRDYACRYYYDLDFPLMNRAALMLKSHTHFGSFCKAGSDNKTDICHIEEVRWMPEGPVSWVFEITADRFLRNMVRAIVGTLIEVGKHRLTLEAFEQVIRAGDRRASGESMPACGLFLENVDYPPDIFQTEKPE